MFDDLSKIKKAGFSGFVSVDQLWNNHHIIPNEKGIYIIVNPDCSKKSFLIKGVGGHFKGKNPNIELTKLDAKWVFNCPILYIGKAGGKNSSATLKSRLKQYLDFGKGKPAGHYGGRFIWQLSHHANLLIAWKIIESGDPRTEEKRLINDFIIFFGKLPFANLSH